MQAPYIGATTFQEKWFRHIPITRSKVNKPMDTVEQPPAPEFAIVDEVIRATAPEFDARGFRLMKVTVNPSKLVRSIDFHFFNDGVGLLLDIGSFLGRDSRKRGFSALLSTPDNRKLNVHNYLVRHGRTDIAQAFTDNAPSDVRAFAEASIRLLLDLLDGELKPIVEGKTFEETPIDWAEYKYAPLRKRSPIDMVEQPLAAEFAKVDEVLRAAAPEFATRGFLLTNTTVEGSLRTVLAVVFHFSNKQANLDLTIRFSRRAMD